MNAETREIRERLELWQLYRVSVSVHRKQGRPESMRVDFVGDKFQQRASEFVCFEHGGAATRRACAWWRMHGGAAPVPKSAREACRRYRQGELHDIVEVVVDPAGDRPFPEVVGHRHRDGQLQVGVRGRPW